MDPQIFSVLDRKRHGKRLGRDAIRAVVEGAATGSWGDAELGAFLMAAAIHGLDESETRELTVGMLESGELWELRRDFPQLGDKHSTGGVGDKTSLILSPLLAACGVPVVMLTGRGLGHTGGTADKLEAIPGVAMGFDRERCCRSLTETGLAIGVATDAIAPADQRLYALRDRTATVASLQLIAASILSKKLATGAASLVFDVKTGNGAFLTEWEHAERLAELLVSISRSLGVAAGALVTDMSQPLGRFAGHAAEVLESLECLEGRGAKDLMELVYELSEETARRAGIALTRADLEERIASGHARERFMRWAEFQGAERDWLADPRLDLAPEEVVIEAPRAGRLARVATRRIGELLAAAGGGRHQPGSTIDFGVSLRVEHRLGDEVAAGEPLARVYLRRRNAAIEDGFRAAFEISETGVAPPLIYGRV